jgi:hypothetical protein
MSLQWLIYLAGVIVFSYFYAPFKAATGSGVWFVLAAAGYLVALRGLGYVVGQVYGKRDHKQP